MISLKKIIKNKVLREWVEAILFAILAAFIIRTWLYAPFRVPTGSMVPTIAVGDQIVADMKAYGWQVPFSTTRFGGKEVNRGDIVIFPNPANPEKCDSAWFSAGDTVASLVIGLVNANYVPQCVDYIKRVVAIGGDQLELSGERVFVNGLPELGYEPFFDARLPAVEMFYEEVVPDGHVLVMGDNRRDSHDARFWNINNAVLSYVPVDRVRAKGKIIYFSRDPQRGIFNGGIRWERIFNILR